MFRFKPQQTDKLEEESLDLKLEALLPSSQLVSSDQPDLSPKSDSEVPDTALLPDLFQKDEKAGTSFTGQVHTDENDNIIGAEVQVAIPTDIN